MLKSHICYYKFLWFVYFLLHYKKTTHSSLLGPPFHCLVPTRVRLTAFTPTKGTALTKKTDLRLYSYIEWCSFISNLTPHFSSIFCLFYSTDQWGNLQRTSPESQMRAENSFALVSINNKIKTVCQSLSEKDQLLL